MLKIVVKLHKISALNLKSSFYEDLRNVVKIKKICVLKMLIATSLNIYRLFFKKLMMTIIIAHKSFEVMKLLVKEYDVTLSSHSIYVVI